MARTIKLQEAYVVLRTDLLDQVDLIETRIVKPATEARDWIQPLKKVIKKRGDKKVRCTMKQELCSGTKYYSWISKSTNPGWMLRERRRIDQNGTMLRWPKRKWSLIEREK